MTATNSQGRTIGMLVHMRCNAACDHCCFESSPQRTEALSVEQLERYVDEVAADGRFGHVVMSGGEPFVRRGAVLAVARRANAHGLTFGVNTNAFWATSDTRAEGLINELRPLGLRNLGLSLDASHARYVDIACVGNAFRAALRCGLHVEVTNATNESGDRGERLARLQESLGVSADDIAFHRQLGQSVKLTVANIVPSGTALKSFDDSYLVKAHISEPELRMRCDAVIETPVVTPLGDLAVCCSPASSTRVGFAEPFVAGNLERESLTAVVDRMEKNRLYRVVHDRGPAALYDMVRSVDPTVIPEEHFVNICHLCVAVTTNPRAVEILDRRFGLVLPGVGAADTRTPAPVPTARARPCASRATS